MQVGRVPSCIQRWRQESFRYFYVALNTDLFYCGNCSPPYYYLFDRKILLILQGDKKLLINFFPNNLHFIKN